MRNVFVHPKDRFGGAEAVATHRSEDACLPLGTRLARPRYLPGSSRTPRPISNRPRLELRPRCGAARPFRMPESQPPFSPHIPEKDHAMPRPPQFDPPRNAYLRPFGELMTLGPSRAWAGSVLEAGNDPGLVMVFPKARAPRRRPLNAGAVAEVAVSALLEVAARRRLA